MAETFAITTTATAVPLEAGRPGQAIFTVSNSSGRALRARARIVPANGVAAPWLTLAGDPEQDFPVAGTAQHRVQIAVPAGAPAGTYAFRLDVVGLDDPDDEFSEGPSVTFQVAASAPPRRPFPWWIPVVAVLLLLLIGGGILAAVLRANPSCVALPAGLTHAYPADGNITDRRGGPPGTAQGILAFAPGEVGQAFSMNGAGAFVDLGPTAANFGTGDFTLEFWINTNAPAQMGIIGNRDDGCAGLGGGGQWFDLRAKNGGVLYELASAGVGITTIASNPNMIADGKFHHVVITRQGAQTGLYIDGTSVQQASTRTVYPINNTTSLVAGKSACTGRDGTGFLTGQLDEIAIYNRALTSAEIQTLAQAGKTPRCPVPAH